MIDLSLQYGYNHSMNVDYLNANYLDVPNRTIYLFFEIEDATACFLVKSLRKLDETPGTINLLINTVGGDVSAGNGIIDTILGLKNKVHAYVVGECASMGVDVLLACDWRTMSPRSTLMIHSGSADIEGDMHSIKNRTDAMQLDLKKSVEFYLTRIKIGKSKLNKLLSTDTVMDAKLSLKYGFVDEIIENKKTFDVTKG